MLDGWLPLNALTFATKWRAAWAGGNGNGNKICVTGVNNAPTTQLATAFASAACHTQSPTHAICNATSNAQKKNRKRKKTDLLAVHKIWRASCNACHNLIPTRTSGSHSLSLHLPPPHATCHRHLCGKLYIHLVQVYT